MEERGKRKERGMGRERGKERCREARRERGMGYAGIVEGRTSERELLTACAP